MAASDATVSRSTPRLIALDWGTSSLRCYLIGDGGEIIARRHSPDGIARIEPGQFASTLKSNVIEWMERYPSLVTVACGMVGARQGWVEAPYLPWPVSMSSLGRSLLNISREAGMPFWVVPGVCASPSASSADVMRGEETQLLGAPQALARGRRLVVLPGTHSKWVWMNGSTLLDFRTYLTGELFTAIRQHTVAGKVMVDRGTPDADTETFLQGVDRMRQQPAALLSNVFRIRADYLLDRQPAQKLPELLSGTLIGSEIAAALEQPNVRRYRSRGTTVALIGEASLSHRYRLALQRYGFRVEELPEDCAARGLYRLARSAGLLRTITP